MAFEGFTVEASSAQIESIHDRADAAETMLVSLLVSVETENPELAPEYRDEILDALEHVRATRSQLAKLMLSGLAKPEK